jgi:CubicO group peptidase (beta-lactamase class C family)
MSHVRRPPALLLAVTLAASLNACGDAKAPTAPEPSVATVTVTAATTTLVPGQSTQLVGSATTAGGQAVSPAPVTWLSDAPTVATVDAAGRVTAVSAGSAVIAATAGTVRGAVTITVQAAPAGSVASLSSIVDSVRLAWKMPAMGAAIVTLEDGLVAIGAAGTRRATGGAAVTTDDLWHLGSNTKAVTSLLAAVAVSQSRIQWTTTIPQAFPELAGIRAEYRDVTLRELLSHQSGITGNPGDAALGSATTAVAQRASVIAWLPQRPPSGSRGTFAYSNLNYIIAGAMLERVFGTSFEAAMTTHVLAPLGMADAGWGPQAAAGSTTQPVAHRRQPDGSWTVLENFDIPPVNASSGTMHLSLASWGRFVREILRVEAGTSTVAPAAVARQTTSELIAIGPAQSYGMGWGVSTKVWASGKVLEHDGSNTGNHSLAVLAPARNVALLITTNGWDPSPTGASFQAVNGLYGRLITFYNTGK